MTTFNMLFLVLNLVPQLGCIIYIPRYISPLPYNGEMCTKTARYALCSCFFVIFGRVSRLLLRLLQSFAGSMEISLLQNCDLSISYTALNCLADRNAFWQLISRKLKMIKNREKKYGKMQTFLNCDLSKFRNDLPNVTIRNSIQTYEFFEIFPIYRFLCTGYLKNKYR